MKKTKIKSDGNYWALLCYCDEDKNKPMICGIYPSKKEAEEVNKDVKDCFAEHKIKRCKVEIII